ncbi:hypothetical protein [Chloroflexus sp.]
MDPARGWPADSPRCDADRSVPGPAGIRHSVFNDRAPTG